MHYNQKSAHEAETGDPLLEKLNNTIEFLRVNSIKAHKDFDGQFLSNTEAGVERALGSYHNDKHIEATVRAIIPLELVMSDHLNSELVRYNQLYGTDIKRSSLIPLMTIAAYLHDNGNIAHLQSAGVQIQPRVSIAKAASSIKVESNTTSADEGIELTFNQIYIAKEAEERGVQIAGILLQKLALPDDHIQFVQRLIMNTKFPFLNQLVETDGVKGDIPQSIKETAPFEIYMKLVDQIGSGWFTKGYLQNLLGLVQEGYIEKGGEAELPVPLENSFVTFLDQQLLHLIGPLGMSETEAEALISKLTTALKSAGGVKGNEQVLGFLNDNPGISEEIRSARTYSQAVAAVKKIADKFPVLE